MKDLGNHSAYDRAKKKVEAEKGFYSHLTAYVIINIALLLMNIDLSFYFIEQLRWQMFITPVLWGIGLAIHWLCVFGPEIRLFKSWEDRKIRELMDEDDF